MNDSYNVIYSSEALEDLVDIFRYIAFDLLSPETAEKQINRIREKIRSLDILPARYPIVDWEPWKSMNMHKMPVDNFIVYYINDNEICKVDVARILYGGRDISEIFET